MNDWLHNSLLSVLVAISALFGGGSVPPADINLGAAPVFTTAQGGTGTSSPSGILYGDETIRLKTVTIGSNLTFSGGTLSATGGASSTLLADSNTFSGNNTFSNTITGAITGNAGSATILQTSRNINGVAFNGSANITINAASSTLLSDNNTFSNTITGSITGNAGTVTNGVYTTTFGTLFDNRLSASSSIAGITTLPNLSLPYSQLTGAPGATGYPFPANATSTELTFNDGLLSTASTTINARFELPSLSAGGLGVDALGKVYSTPTTTAGTGLTHSAGAFNVNTSQNIATLSNLTSNGFVKTGSGNGTLSVDTTTYESGLTAGDGLTRTVNDFDCDTASGSVFGCLSATDWNTFNGKESVLSFTWPLIRSTNTISFGGLSTSSPIAAASGLLYATGVNTIASVSTSSAVNLSITGNAVSLADNGNNCAAGSYPLGVDAFGVAEDCTSTFAYPFPSNATTTLLSFNGGASTTLLSANYASSTLYYGAGLADCNTGNMLTWTAGRFGCEDDSTGAGGGTSDFTFSSHYGGITAATSSAIWAQGNVYASSSIFIGPSGGLLTNSIGDITNAASISLDPVSVSVGADSITFGAANNRVLSLTTSGYTFYNPTDKTALLNFDNLTDARTFTFPDVAGTLCLTSTCANFAYLFPSNATTTLIAFNGGLSSASTTLTGPFIFANATGTNATTTSFFATTASSTNLYGANLAACQSGSFLTWASGLFGCDTDDNTTYTAGDALTLTGNDIDFDGGATPAGDLGGTWASPSVTDDSHAHTGATISGLDISGDTNLTAGDGLTLTDDDLDCDTASGSVFGCLSAANWTTFNNKIGWGDATSTSANQFVYTNNDGKFVSAASSSLSLPNTALQNSTISGVALGANLAALTATDSSLTFSGSYTGATARTVGLNVGNANTWTALQTFANASSTLFSSTYASTTNQVIGNNLTFGGVTGNSWDDFCTSITGGAGLCDGDDATGAGGGWPFTPVGATQSTTSIMDFKGGFMATGSSTVQELKVTFGTTTNATSTTLNVSGQVDFDALTSALIVTGAGGILAEYAGAGCTNQVVEDIDAVGGTTCVSINNGYWSGTDLSVANGGTGLSTFGGSNHILYTTAADTLASEAAFTYTAGSNLLNVDNITLSSTGELLIPSAANPTISTAREFSIESTAASTSLRYHDGTAERVVNDIYDRSTGPVASSSLAYIGAYGTAGTTSLLYMNPEHPLTVLAMRCKTDANTAFVQVSDGTNLGTLIPCTTSGVRTAVASNGSFVEGEDFKINFGSRSATGPNTITVTITLRDDAD